MTPEVLTPQGSPRATMKWKTGACFHGEFGQATLGKHLPPKTSGNACLTRITRCLLGPKGGGR